MKLYLGALDSKRLRFLGHLRKNRLKRTFSQIGEKKVRTKLGKSFGGGHPSGDGDATYAVGFGSEDIVFVVAKKDDRGGSGDPPVAAGMGNGPGGEGGARLALLGKRAEGKVIFQAGAIHFGPADHREVARDESSAQPAAGDTTQKAPDAGADFPAQVRAAFGVETLRVLNHLRHGAANARGTGSRVPHHPGKNVAIQHALHRYLLRGGFQPRYQPDCLHQNLAMMRT